MEKVNALHVLYKKLGESPLDAISRFKKENPEFQDIPMTYAGRLDPMAEGILLVLSGEKAKEKDSYLGLPKTYEVEILWGFETDTLDVLGLITQDSFSTYPSKDTDKFLLKFSSSSLRRASLVPSQDTISTNLVSGTCNQKYPAYSSKPVDGKALFQWAREGKIGEVEIPSHEVEIFDTKFVSRRIISKKELLEDIVSKIGKVSGDFRQKEILNTWHETMSKTVFDTYAIDTIKLSVSSGFYVRQFVSDLAEKLGTKAITFHIKRTKVGEYGL